MTTPAERRDQFASNRAIEDAATNLAAFEGSAAFDPHREDTMDRFEERQEFRARVRVLLEDADAYNVCRAIAQLIETATPGSRAEQVARCAYAAAIAAAGVKP